MGCIPAPLVTFSMAEQSGTFYPSCKGVPACHRPSLGLVLRGCWVALLAGSVVLIAVCSVWSHVTWTNLGQTETVPQGKPLRVVDDPEAVVASVAAYTFEQSAWAVAECFQGNPDFAVAMGFLSLPSTTHEIADSLRDAVVLRLITANDIHNLAVACLVTPALIDKTWEPS